MIRATSAFLILFCTTSLAADLKSPSSAEACGDCHRAIEQGWKKSAHANAVESRLFQDAQKMAEQDFGNQARKVCLGCHSPIAVMTGDLELVKKVSWEGITCDYCHSIRDVSTAGANPKADIEFSSMKSGPSKDSVSPVHMTRFSAVHTTSLVCITCHEYANSQGLHVLTTYSEWKNAGYGKSDQGCQTCHMYTVKGNVVDTRVEPSPATTINLHEIPGSHSLDQLNKAIKAALFAKRNGDQVQVEVRITNQGAGHYVPTGSPLRQLILNLRAESYSGQRFNEEKIYRRTVADRNGTILNSEPVVFIKGAKIVSDTRLAPKETKIEKISFPMKRGSLIRVVASLSYYYSPLATTAQEQKVRFLELTSLVR